MLAGKSPNSDMREGRADIQIGWGSQEPPVARGPKDHINIRILLTMESGQRSLC